MKAKEKINGSLCACSCRLSTVAINCMAKGLLESYSPRSLIEPSRVDSIELWELLQDLEIISGAVEVLPEGVEWADMAHGKVVLSEATYNNALHGDGRARFTIVHEIKHGLYHASQLQEMLKIRIG